MEKLLEVQKKLLKFKKNWKANYGKYITLDDLLDHLLPVCNDLDILVYHTMSDSKVITTVMSWKQSITSEFPITDLSSPQKVGASITYAKRYNLGQIFNIVTDDDTDDWNKVKEVKKERFVFWLEQLEKFKKDRNKHKEKLTTYSKALTMIADANYSISKEVSDLLKVFYDDLSKPNA